MGWYYDGRGNPSPETRARHQSIRRTKREAAKNWRQLQRIHKQWKARPALQRLSNDPKMDPIRLSFEKSTTENSPAFFKGLKKVVTAYTEMPSLLQSVVAGVIIFVFFVCFLLFVKILVALKLV
jgi:ferric-dicitrate binding protein FerR (iron transport regulator)